MLKTLTFILSLSLLLACQSEPKLETLSGQAQGTTYQLKFWREKSIKLSPIKQAVKQELQRLDKLISTYRSDSTLEKFNAYKGTHPFVTDPEIIQLIGIAKTVYTQSNHCFDPSIEPLFKLWGFQADSFNKPSQERINQILQSVGLDNITVSDNKITRNSNPNTTLDLSGIGQGYSVAKLAEILELEGIHNYLVEIGGEMLVKGKKPDGSNWRIAIERPTPNSTKFHKVITLVGGQPVAVMTSGTYLHYFDADGQRYSHVLDPRTGRPVEHDTVSVTTLMDNPTQADAWSTALLCLGSEQGLKIANQYQVPALFIDLKNGNLIETRSDTIDNKKLWEIN